MLTLLSLGKDENLGFQGWFFVTEPNTILMFIILGLPSLFRNLVRGEGRERGAEEK